MKLGIVQVNATPGDLTGNVTRCARLAREAANAGADLVVLPEMVVPGYPPRDILYDTSFAPAVQDATNALAAEVADLPPVVVGSLRQGLPVAAGHPGLINTAVLLHRGTTRIVAEKQLLPIYDVFHEPRWFMPGRQLMPVPIAGQSVGFLICEDLWDTDYPLSPATALVEAGADLLVCLAASPYRAGIQAERISNARGRGVPVVHVNLVGGNDELIFDGQSFAVSAVGNVQTVAPAFAETVQVIDLGTSFTSGSPPVDLDGERFAALTTGLRDFAAKNGLAHAVLGLSGGVDSSVVAAIATHALGGDNVTGVAMPSRYSDPRSTASARELAANLGMHFAETPIAALHRAAETSLASLLDGGTTAENVQARLRALILMAYVNQKGGFLLNTSNKTELTLGYGTLYGDLAGAISPIGDLTKPEVYALAHWLNRTEPVIPPFIVARPPSAELKENQVDPFDYDAISPQLETLVQANQSNSAIRRSEHKRWQFGVVLRVSAKAFGRGRLMPITRG